LPILVSTDILEFQTLKNGDDCIYKSTPFNDEIREAVEEKGSSLKPEELNTVVVAAREEGFEKEVIGNSQWYAIRTLTRISLAKLRNIK